MALLRQPLPLVQYWVEGDGDGFWLSAAGMMEGVGGGRSRPRFIAGPRNEKGGVRELGACESLGVLDEV